MKKVVITQSIEQAKDFVTLLNHINVEVVVFPVIKVVPLPITHELKDIFSNLQKYDWLIFNSINSVRYFFFILMNQFLKFPANRPKISCMGEKTVKTLRTYGKNPDFFLEDQNVNDFYSSFIQDNSIIETDKILVPVSLEELNTKSEIDKTDCKCQFLPIYETRINKFIPMPQIGQIKNMPELIITFFNRLAFENFIKFIPVNEFNKSWDIIAGGKITAAIIKKHGIKNFSIAKEAKSNSLFEEVKKLMELPFNLP